MRILGQNPTEQELDEMIKDVDEDGNGEIDFDEFVKLMIKNLNKEGEAEEELVEVFKVFDKDGDGKVGLEDLREVFFELEEKLSDKDLGEMIEEHDHNGDGFLDFEEFVRMMMAK